MNWEKLTNDVVSVTSNAFASLMSEKADEHFYAFALYTDGDAYTILPAANSIERYEAKVRDTNETDELQIASYKWATAEWAYEAWHSKLFTGIYGELEKHRESMSRAETDYGAYKKSVHQCMIAALKRMDEGGFFAKGRENTVLFVTSSDDDEAFDLENNSARLLNSDRIYSSFMKRYETGDFWKS